MQRLDAAPSSAVLIGGGIAGLDLSWGLRKALGTRVHVTGLKRPAPSRARSRLSTRDWMQIARLLGETQGVRARVISANDARWIQPLLACT